MGKCTYIPEPVFSYKLRYIAGFGLVEMAISTNPKPTIYHNVYDNTTQRASLDPSPKACCSYVCPEESVKQNH